MYTNIVIDSITDPMDMSLSKFWETVKDKEAWCAGVYRVTKSDLINNERLLSIVSYCLMIKEFFYIIPHFQYIFLFFQFLKVMSDLYYPSYCVDYVIIKCLSLFLVTVFSSLFFSCYSHTGGFFWLLFSWYIFFSILLLSNYLCL